MSRRFTVSHINAEGFRDFSVSTPRAEEAVAHFRNAVTSEHDGDTAEIMHRRLTIALLDGRHELTVLDPDLKGSTSITIEK